MADFKRIIQRTTNSERVETGVADLQPNEICIVEDGEELIYKDRNGKYISVSKDKYKVGTIEDLKKSKKYKIGDVVEVLGYYTPGDGGGHPRQKVPEGYIGEDSIIGNDGSIWSIAHSGEVNILWFGAKGDGISDDSSIIQKCFNFMSWESAGTIKFPPKRFMCLSPITIEETMQKELSYFKVVGSGFEYYDRGRDDKIKETKIIFKNLKSNQGGFNFIGLDNGWSNSTSMSNIDLDATHESNHKWSSAIKIGASRMATFEKCTFQGKNGANIISGLDPTTYAFINSIFRDCRFRTFERVGFSIFNGVIFEGYATYSATDNATYENCIFYGTAMFYGYNDKITGCMSVCDTANAETNYIFSSADGVKPFFYDYVVDFRNAMYIGSASALTIQGSYFEDYENAVVLYPFKGGIVECVNVIGCHFSIYKNVTGFPRSPRQFLVKNAPRNEGGVNKLNLFGNSFFGYENETILSEVDSLKINENCNAFKGDYPFKVTGKYRSLVSMEKGFYDKLEFAYDNCDISGYDSEFSYSKFNIKKMTASYDTKIIKLDFITNIKLSTNGAFNIIYKINGVARQIPLDRNNFVDVGGAFKYTALLGVNAVSQITSGDILEFGAYSSIGSQVGVSGLLNVYTGN